MFFSTAIRPTVQETPDATARAPRSSRAAALRGEALEVDAARPGHEVAEAALAQGPLTQAFRSPPACPPTRCGTGA